VTGRFSKEETNEAEGDTGGKDGCWGDRVTPAEDADADASGTATPDTAASTCAKARVDAAPQARSGKSELPRTAWIAPGAFMR